MPACWPCANALQPLSGLPHPPAHWRDELPELAAGGDRACDAHGGLQAEIEELAAARDGVDLDEPALASRGERIDELQSDARARFVTAEKDLPERRRSLADHDAAIAKLAATAGARAANPIPTGWFSALRSWARA